ncbi:MAG TPA: 6-carboxytetrahydropterin synthase [Syntrophales bacterium]|nr:6-carboxytetrahydropterin synthase [Syntrophales bacterium]HOX94925.1 6-carboxytetrahydropterin synthase [Syntrophales bacterium]HPI58333.1 6-carboxytetrahydropterin synthase [Syntrophales bacterium]HPN26151.1 6-carboxytetrahydropterin synthase [Syntrophales bacterium]HQM30528.1 6-carboxytetrahydropterin synthase [Syntrophales bacterium]
MYTLGIAKDFTARHYLVGGDWGVENKEHAHHYRIEVSLEGRDLDRHGYLVDLTDLEVNLEELIGGFRDRVLNHLPRLKGLNPSIERLARILCNELCSRLQHGKALSLHVRVWENENAWASYRRDMP